ncbi:MAG: L-threonylcarbamoyladenylate synthase [Elusimicrobiota bacterium]
MRILKPTEKNIKLCAKAIKKGEVVAFPTETVYGLGADVFNKESVAKIFEIKKRPKFDPLIVHISDRSQLKILVKKIPSKIKILIDKFWPGPLTLVMEKKKNVPDIVTSALNTVAVRMPNNEIALKLIKYSKTPIAAPSANKFTRISPTTAFHITRQFENEIPFILDGGKTDFGVESTIIKYEKKRFYLLRKGAISKEEIEKAIKDKVIDKKSKKIDAPGQFKKHYAPLAKVIIIKDDSNIKEDLKAGYIAFCKKPKKKFKMVKVLSFKKDLKEAASNLFDFFHQFEEKGIKKIYVEKISEKGLGAAIMDRIKKAAGV